MKIAFFVKLEDGSVNSISERAWDDKIIACINAANYLVVGSQEYEMIEGRLNLDLEQFELLLRPVDDKESQEKDEAST
jgi:hypothetical protein